MMRYLLLSTIVVFVILFATQAYLLWNFLQGLRQRHRETWEQLGSPTMILNNTIRNNVLVARFLFRGDFKRLGDEELVRSGRAIVVLFYVYFVVFSGLVTIRIALF